LSQLIKNDKLGRIVEFETHFDRHRPEPTSTGWKTKPLPGGGVVYDLGAHLIDQVVVVFGMPKRITGFVGSQREDKHNPDGFEDSCTVLLHYPGLLATVKAGVVSLEAAQLRYWVRGTDGTYKKVRGSVLILLSSLLISA
jgi:predicted dehydrogenase